MSTKRVTRFESLDRQPEQESTMSTKRNEKTYRDDDMTPEAQMWRRDQAKIANSRRALEANAASKPPHADASTLTREDAERARLANVERTKAANKKVKK